MRMTIISAAVALGLAGLAMPASAQHAHGGSTSAHGHSGSAAGTVTLPEECRRAAADMPKGMGEMQGMAMQGMTDAQKAYMDAMMKMHPPMMTGVHAKDADMAFVCGMIPHHQGAIEMARVVLKYGDNAEAKRMAEKVIKDQSQEIEEMTAWLKKNAK